MTGADHATFWVSGSVREQGRALGGCGAMQQQQTPFPGSWPAWPGVCSSVDTGQCPCGPLLEGAVVLAVGEGARATGASQPARASPCHPESQQFLPCALRAAEVAEAQGLPEPV